LRGLILAREVLEDRQPLEVREVHCQEGLRQEDHLREVRRLFQPDLDLTLLRLELKRLVPARRQPALRHPGPGLLLLPRLRDRWRQLALLPAWLRQERQEQLPQHPPPHLPMEQPVPGQQDQVRRQQQGHRQQEHQRQERRQQERQRQGHRQEVRRQVELRR